MQIDSTALRREVLHFLWSDSFSAMTCVRKGAKQLYEHVNDAWLDFGRD